MRKLPEFDQLVKDGKLTQAAKYIAWEYYANGKMGHTRKTVIEELAEKVEEQEEEIKELNEAKHLNATKSNYYRKLQERYHDVLHVIKTTSNDATSVDIAEKALYTKQDLDSEPCDYCKSIEEATSKSPRKKYRFCPMCGRVRR